MAVTQVRGGTSTPEVRGFGEGRLVGASRRAFRLALLVATLAHLPLAPAVVPGWLARLFRREEAVPPLPEEVVVPIDLDLGFEDEAPPPPPPSEAPAAAVEVEADDDDEKDDDADVVAERLAKEKAERERLAKEKAERERLAKEKAERERLAKEQEERERVARASASGAPSASAAAPFPSASAVGSAGVVPAPLASASASPGPPRAPVVEEATTLAGGAGAVQAKATNVMMYLATDVVRRHELGPMLGDLLSKIPQWRELLGGTDLDALRDFNHVWLTGPHMQSARVVVAVVEYNIGTARMQRAIEAAMAASVPPGKWLTRTPAPLGTLGSGAAQRVSLRADKRVVIVAPAEAEEQLRQAKDLRFNKSGSTLFAMTMRTPWRGFMHTTIRFPKSITLLRLTLTPEQEGFMLKLEATDTSAATAEASSRELADAIEEVRDPPILAPWFDKPSFEVRGEKIFGEVRISNVQVRRILNLVSGFLAMQKK